MRFLFFFFNETATTEIYTLSLHDALPILNRYRKSCFLQQHGRCQTHGTASQNSDWSSVRSEEHTSELQSHSDLVCRLLLEKKKIRPRTRLSPRAPRLTREPSTAMLAVCCT